MDKLEYVWCVAEKKKKRVLIFFQFLNIMSYYWSFTRHSLTSSHPCKKSQLPLPFPHVTPKLYTFKKKEVAVVSLFFQVDQIQKLSNILHDKETYAPLLTEIFKIFYLINTKKENQTKKPMSKVMLKIILPNSENLTELNVSKC